MKKNGLWIVFVCGLWLATAGLLGVGIYFFADGRIVSGVVALAAAVIALYFALFFVYQKRRVSSFLAAVGAKDYERAREIAERTADSHLIFYPLMRLDSLQMRLNAAMALDDLDKAADMIAAIRHNGGYAWRYRTAYFHILILLDREEYAEARKEYADFRADNHDVELYRPQIEVLEAVFSRLFLRDDLPLPDAVLTSSLPVVQRILGRHFDREAQRQPDDDWD